MKLRLAAYVLAGGFVGGLLLPGSLHGLDITVFASTEGIATHIIGGLLGILAGWRLGRSGSGGNASKS